MGSYKTHIINKIVSIDANYDPRRPLEIGREVFMTQPRLEKEFNDKRVDLLLMCSGS